MGKTLSTLEAAVFDALTSPHPTDFQRLFRRRVADRVLELIKGTPAGDLTTTEDRIYLLELIDKMLTQN